MCQMLKVGADVRVMLNASTVPFLSNTALKSWYHVASREYFGSDWSEAGKRCAVGWACTWAQGKCLNFPNKSHNKKQQVCFQQDTLYLQFVRPCLSIMQDTTPAWSPRRGGFDVGRNEGPSLPDSRRKTGSLAPSFLPDSRVRSRRGVAWYHRRRSDVSMCPALKTAWQHLRLHRKGLDIDAKFATEHMACTGTVHSSPTASFSHWSLVTQYSTPPQMCPAFLWDVCLFANPYSQGDASPCPVLCAW